MGGFSGVADTNERLWEVSVKAFNRPEPDRTIRTEDGAYTALTKALDYWLRTYPGSTSFDIERIEVRPAK